MKIAAYLHTELLKDPALPFSVELPGSAVFRGALLGAGQPSLIAGLTGKVFPVVIMGFSYFPEDDAKVTRWFRVFTSPVEFQGPIAPAFLALLWEQRPPQQGQPPQFPAPVLLYEVEPPQ
jgi:hypothetical protein